MFERAKRLPLLINMVREDIVFGWQVFFVYTPQEAVYLFSGSYPEFNKFYAPALLQSM